MKVDAQQFMDQGFIILRNVVPPERLQEMRLTIELLVEIEAGCASAEFRVPSLAHVSHRDARRF